MAINLGLANDYNVFVFGDMSLSNTDAEGRGSDCHRGERQNLLRRVGRGAPDQNALPKLHRERVGRARTSTSPQVPTPAAIRW